MNSTLTTKFAFRIRTRLGVVVDNLLIHGRDEEDAQRKLRQMYRGCEILESGCHRANARSSLSSFEDVVNLIVR